MAIVDDVLASGKTLEAAMKLVNCFGAHVVLAVVIAEFPFHRGRAHLSSNLPVHSLLCFRGA